MSAQQIFDRVIEGVLALGRHQQRLRRIDELRSEVAARNRCGECLLWMTRSCPREKPTMTGYSSGPNCNGAVCGQFAMKPYVSESRAAKAAELAQLLSNSTGAPA